MFGGILITDALVKNLEIFWAILVARFAALCCLDKEGVEVMASQRFWICGDFKIKKGKSFSSLSLLNFIFDVLVVVKCINFIRNCGDGIIT